MLLAKVDPADQVPSTRTLYLSKIEFDVQSQTVREDLSDRYKLHQRIMTMAPDGVSGEDIRLLYRVEPSSMSRTNSVGSILIQSLVQPDATRLPNGYRLVGTKDLAKPYSTHCKAGATFRILLVASPSKVVSNEMGFEKKKKRFIVNAEERIQWFARKAQMSGCRVLEKDGRLQVLVSPLNDVIGRKDNMRILYRPVLFTSLITIEDEKRFLEAIEEGIGRGKAFGMGLATIRKI